MSRGPRKRRTAEAAKEVYARTAENERETMETKTYQDCLTAANTILGLWDGWEAECGQHAANMQDDQYYEAGMREHLADAIHAVVEARLEAWRQEIRNSLRLIERGAINTAERRLENLLGES